MKLWNVVSGVASTLFVASILTFGLSTEIASAHGNHNQPCTGPHKDDPGCDDGGGGQTPDTTPPASITDLRTASYTPVEMRLRWTSTGDDGNNVWLWENAEDDGGGGWSIAIDTFYGTVAIVTSGESTEYGNTARYVRCDPMSASVICGSPQAP